MHFVLINDIFNQKGLNKPTLEVLNLDANLYNTLLFQPVDTIECTAQFIRIANRNLAEQKFNGFFDIAIENNVELAITPEYSCPWTIIEQLIEENRLPQESKLWIVGCESIQSQQLLDIINHHNEIVWIYDEERVQQNLTNNHFFDPVCYLFKTRTQGTNELRTIVIVQFKTHFMGNTPWERDNYIPGRNIYILENQNQSSRLLTFICSDTLHQNLNIQADLPQGPPRFAIYPYIIIHLQLNPSPFNTIFTRYRGDIFDRNQDNKEVICLNWGRFVQMNATANWNNYGGSAIFTKSTQLDLRDERINHNQDKGLYFTRWTNRRSNIYFLNFDEHIFCIRNTKPSQAEEFGVMQGRTGPEVLFIRNWDNTGQSWNEIERANDGFNDLCLSIKREGNFNTLFDGELSRVNLERLIALSVGEAVQKDWYDVQKNRFFLIDDDGINKRMTFTQDPCPVTNETRRSYLMRYAILANHIIEHDEYFPDVISDLKGNCKVSYSPGDNNTSYNVNLFPFNGDGAAATGIYKGEVEKTAAIETYQKTANLFPESQNWTRIVVWYRDVEGYKNVTGAKPKISDNASKPFNSINTIRK